MDDIAFRRKVLLALYDLREAVQILKDPLRPAGHERLLYLTNMLKTRLDEIGDEL